MNVFVSYSKAAQFCVDVSLDPMFVLNHRGYVALLLREWGLQIKGTVIETAQRSYGIAAIEDHEQDFREIIGVHIRLEYHHHGQPIQSEKTRKNERHTFLWIVLAIWPCRRQGNWKIYLWTSEENISNTFDMINRIRIICKGSKCSVDWMDLEMYTVTYTSSSNPWRFYVSKSFDLSCKHPWHSRRQSDRKTPGRLESLPPPEW